MSALRKFIAATGVYALLGVGVLSAGPAVAQGWNDNGYDPRWREPYRQPDQGEREWRPQDNYGYSYGYRPAYDDRGYGGPTYDDPYYGRVDPGVGYGVTEVAICPGGYHLGRSGRLCWPD
jgi:hypothetical protein